MKVLPLFSIFFFLVISLIPIVHAEGGVSLTEFPTKLAEQLGTSSFVGNLIATGLMLMLFLMPTIIFVRGASQDKALLLVGIVVLGISVGLGWLPFWFMVMLTFGIAVLFAKTIKGAIS